MGSERVTFFRDSVSSSHDSLSREFMPCDEQAKPLRPLRILVADDSQVNRMVVTAALQKDGHTVIGVTNGREAVDAVSSGGYDIVLMDDQMPEMDGVAATRAIRALVAPHSEIPVIALTGNVYPEDQDRYAEAGMSGFVSKPVDFAALRDEMRRVLGL
jgi:two-component system, sensor histidine kinase